MSGGGGGEVHCAPGDQVPPRQGPGVQEGLQLPRRSHTKVLHSVSIKENIEFDLFYIKRF